MQLASTGYGIGTMKRRAGVIFLDDEDILWKTGTIGIDTPVKLLRAVFYYNGTNFALRGGDRGTAQLEVTRRSQRSGGEVENYSIYVFVEP